MKIVNGTDTTRVLFQRWRTLACLAGISSLVAMLIGCMVGPKYSRPTVESPPEYKEQTARDAQEGGEWKKAQPSETITRGKWWEVFHDSYLNALEERVNISNQDLKTAEA